LGGYTFFCVCRPMYVFLGSLIPFTQHTLITAFNPPRHPHGMKALLDYSMHNYGPLPKDLWPRRHRSRTLSRPSPYPPRTVKTSMSSDQTRPTPNDLNMSRSFTSAPLQPVNINPNSSTPTVEAGKQFSPNDSVDGKHILGPSATRPRVPSITRRTALGWSKRSTGKKTSSGKENVVGLGQGVMMTCVYPLTVHH
jgi:serine/arginine repetitive matrix protein 2